MKLVFTGGLEHMTRKTAEAKAKAAGYTVAHSVSASTDYLIAAGKSLSGGSRKLAAAKRLGVPVIGEREFMGMI